MSFHPPMSPTPAKIACCTELRVQTFIATHIQAGLGRALLLPQLEQTALHSQIRFQEACWSPSNVRAVATKVPTFLCPSASGGSDGFAVLREVDHRHGTPILRDDGSQIEFAHSHYVTNSGIHQPWGRAPAYCYDYEVENPFLLTAIVWLGWTARSFPIRRCRSNVLLTD